jgi:hypothetical protein
MMWFAAHPNIEPIMLTIRHPAVKGRAFISDGYTYAQQQVGEVLKNVMETAIKGKV